jgi:hypothetical protein
MSKIPTIFDTVPQLATIFVYVIGVGYGFSIGRPQKSFGGKIRSRSVQFNQFRIFPVRPFPSMNG